MELLAPAGDPRAFLAALQYGADAVYLGYTAFGARGYAGNFDEDALREAVWQAHVWGRRVYVTINTLVLPREYQALESLLTLLSDIRVDAVIIQDAGVARLARHAFPDLTLHASTQMGLHNRQGARVAKSLGYTRVVPARECSLQTLSEMAAEGIEIEAFVHGALCVSMSGQCLFSSMLGGRSGNRGRCAQPCRLPYTFQNAAGYWLSPRDLCLIDDLPALRQAGVSALKIEGRMKRPEYVAVVTALYRKHLDALLDGHPLPVSQADVEELRQVFHRGGFTRGYALGKAHAEILYPERPNHCGLSVGRVERVQGRQCHVRLSRSIQDGDSLQITGKRQIDITYHGERVEADESLCLRIPQPVAVGDSVVRLTDAAQMKRMEALREDHPVEIDVTLSLTPGQVPVLRATDGHHQVEVHGETPVQAAQNHPMTRMEVRAQVDRLGDTPYRMNRLFYQDEGGFLPRSQMNAMRREAIAELTERRGRRSPGHKNTPEEPRLTGPADALLIAQSPTLADARELQEAGAEALYWQPEDYRPNALRVALRSYSATMPLALVLPPFLSGEAQEALYAFVEAEGERISGLVLSNPGQFSYAGKLPLYGDFSLHTPSRWSAAAWSALGARRLTLSPELNAKQVDEILSGGGNFEILAYGRTQMMLLSHCMRRVQAGIQVEDGQCDRCGREAMPPLIDRKGIAFPQSRIRLSEGCRIRIWNSLPTYIGKYYQTIRTHAASLRAVFTDEPIDRQRAVLQALRALREGKTPELPVFSATHGHYGRGVE